MIESYVGLVIAVAASTSLLISLALSNKAIKNSGLHNLNKDEIRIIESAGYSKSEIESLEIYIKELRLEEEWWIFRKLE